ncbi:MFS family permease [Salinibacter ruber]|uniref:MFS transporter n=1 Tax=Salinibacter ruber TaxID=146919 RepID=UPI0021675FC7|nr:MFS transporter [Salinibacter ruber]MCS3861951.1 MFS family permease [Salinibacter ruber]
MASPKRLSALVERSPVYYGWGGLSVATLGMAATLPGQTAGLSLFIDAFIEDLGLSRSAVSWLYTGAMVLGSLGLPLAGRLLDRYGPRRVAVVLIALPAASCAGMRWVSGWDWARPGPRRSSRPSWKGAARPTAGRRRA